MPNLAQVVQGYISLTHKDPSYISGTKMGLQNEVIYSNVGTDKSMCMISDISSIK